MSSMLMPYILKFYNLHVDVLDVGDLCEDFLHVDVLLVDVLYVVVLHVDVLHVDVLHVVEGPVHPEPGGV